MSSTPTTATLNLQPGVPVTITLAVNGVSLSFAITANAPVQASVTADSTTITADSTQVNASDA